MVHFGLNLMSFIALMEWNTAASDARQLRGQDLTADFKQVIFGKPPQQAAGSGIFTKSEIAKKRRLHAEKTKELGKMKHELEGASSRAAGVGWVFDVADTRIRHEFSTAAGKWDQSRAQVINPMRKLQRELSGFKHDSARKPVIKGAAETRSSSQMEIYIRASY